MQFLWQRVPGTKFTHGDLFVFDTESR